MTSQNLPKKESLSSVLDASSNIAENPAELLDHQDLTPTQLSSTRAENPAPTLDSVKQATLENDLHRLKQKAEAETEAQVRAQIAQIQAQAQAGREHLQSQTTTDIQELSYHANAPAPLSFQSHLKQFFSRHSKLSRTSLTAYEIWSRKAAQQSKMQQEAQASSNSGLSESGKVLRFGNSTGEDDTNQKAA